MYFHDEIRDFGEVDEDGSGAVKDNEVTLALRLIGELTSPSFDPKQNEDEYRQRVLRLIHEKVEGKEATAAP